MTDKRTIADISKVELASLGKMELSDEALNKVTGGSKRGWFDFLKKIEDLVTDVVKKFVT